MTSSCPGDNSLLIAILHRLVFHRLPATRSVGVVVPDEEVRFGKYWTLKIKSVEDAYLKLEEFLDCCVSKKAIFAGDFFKSFLA